MANVGLVVVSHSRTLATGVKELSLQVTRHALDIWAVGGTEDGTIGTSATAIKECLEEALGRTNEVVVLMDLGSAQLNTKMAIELLDPDLQRRVQLADAPLVEGAFLGAVALSSGQSATRVRESAEEARDMRKLL